jgi:hypothetical protein
MRVRAVRLGFPRSPQRKLLLKVEPSLRAANPLNSQFNRLWSASEPFSPEGNRIAQDPNFLAA